MNQNLSSYWIFYTVANAGNISKAAKELYISQPAISKSIQKLEENLGCKLFSRSSRGVVLTDEGQLLYGHVKEAFETLTLGEDKLKRSIDLGVGHLQIGVSSTLCKFVLLPYLKEFIRQNPHISISINCQSTNETLDLLDENKIDIGLIGKPDNLKNINFYYLDNIEDIFVANPDYLSNLKKRGITRDSILGNSTLMLLDKHNMTRQYIDDYLQDNHISVAESIDISNMDLLIDFAKIGVGVACVIKSFVTKELQEGSLVEIPLGIPIHKREIGFAYKENLKPSKSLQTFIDFYRTYRPDAMTEILGTTAMEADQKLDENRLQFKLAAAEARDAAAQLSPKEAAEAMRRKADEARDAARRASEISRLNAAEAAKAVKLAAKGTAERTAELLQLEQLAEELAARSEELRERTRRTAHFGKGRMLRAYPRLRHGTKQLTLDELRERLKYEHKHSA